MIVKREENDIDGREINAQIFGDESDSISIHLSCKFHNPSRNDSSRRGGQCYTMSTKSQGRSYRHYEYHELKRRFA